MANDTKEKPPTQTGVTTLLKQAISSPPLLSDPSVVSSYGHLLIQAVVALVSVWATIRRALRQPEPPSPPVQPRPKQQRRQRRPAAGARRQRGR